MRTGHCGMGTVLSMPGKRDEQRSYSLLKSPGSCDIENWSLWNGNNVILSNEMNERATFFLKPLYFSTFLSFTSPFLYLEILIKLLSLDCSTLPLIHTL